MSVLNPSPTDVRGVDWPVYEMGDRVRLRQGGPLMIVHDNDDGHVECVWVEYGTVLQRDHFAADQLIPASGLYPANFEAMRKAVAATLTVFTAARLPD